VTANSRPQSVSAALDAGMLNNQVRLRQADHGVVHPDLQGIRSSKIQYNNPSAERLQRPNASEIAQSPDNRANSLGHEMTHAWRASNGLGVGPLDVSKHAQHPTIQKYNEPDGSNFPKTVINQHAQLKEEFETVGLQPTPGRPHAPSENKIRQELGMPRRMDYSGARPNGKIDEALKDVDAGTDKRWGVQKNEKSPFYRPSDIQKIVSDLEK
jgi:hypothetical protein